MGYNRYSDTYILYALVDNMYNLIWSLDDTFEKAANLLDLQPKRENYRIEELKKSDYIAEDGRLITNEFRVKRKMHPSGCFFS